MLSSGLPGWRWLTQVREHNAAQEQAQAALAGGHAPEAVYYYQQAVALAGRRGPSPTLLLNLGQAQQLAGQTSAARATYARLLAPTVPAAVGSAARQQLAGLLAQQRQVAQAVGLLRQALKLNPANATARYNYELLSQYLAGQQPDNPALPADAPPPPPSPKRNSKAPQQNGSAPTPAEKAGTTRPGQAPRPTPSPPAGTGGTPQPNIAGQPDRQHPTPGAGSSANGGLRPGQGERQPLASGATPGRQRGLDTRAAASGAGAPTGIGGRPGTEAATNADLQLQTQRERLKAMNLTPAQAQQVLEALRESEQQYLQQRPRPRQGAAPAPGQPTW
ncbi:tetratricopeptide repeat protein [Hymenobacter ginsengisoli]|uniref:tetratricopeptide repeat protein n=1 Tax=Hymenobacter ginsengisoli TaxID=1051626 RepID=UPI0031EAD302